MYEYLHLWFLWKTWNHWEYPKKIFHYTIDQDILFYILNLKFIFVTYVFVPYFVIFMECFVECYRQKLIFKINWKIGTPIAHAMVNKRKIQLRIRLLTRMNFFLWFSSSMSSISSRSMSTLFGNSVWKTNEIIKKCARCSALLGCAHSARMQVMMFKRSLTFRLTMYHQKYKTSS